MTNKMNILFFSVSTSSSSVCVITGGASEGTASSTGKSSPIECVIPSYIGITTDFGILKVAAVTFEKKPW